MAAELLLVEDSSTRTLQLKQTLRWKGLKVTVAHTGREGIALAVLLRPAVVVLDANLPDLDGFQVCQALKDYPATRGIPVILLTVQGQAADRQAGVAAGADAYIPKEPFAESLLLEALHDLGVLQRSNGGSAGWK